MATTNQAKSHNIQTTKSNQPKCYFKGSPARKYSRQCYYKYS